MGVKMREWVLVTGAAKRVGREIAMHLGKNSFNVIVHYNSSERDALQTVQDVKALGVEALALQFDFAKLDSVGGFFQDDRLLGLNITHLINNSSIYLPDDFAGLNPAQITDSLNINALAPMFLSRAFSKLPSAKSIINIIDSRHKKLAKGYFSYSLSKKLLYEITNSLAIELAPKLRVNAVAPGLIMTNPVNINEDLEAVKKQSLLEDISALPDTLAAIDFLLANPRITGQTIYTDSGRNML